MRAFAIILGLTFLVAACDLVETDRSRFMDACTGPGGSSPENCACAYEALERFLSPEQRKIFVDSMVRNQGNPGPALLVLIQDDRDAARRIARAWTNCVLYGRIDEGLETFLRVFEGQSGDRL